MRIRYLFAVLLLILMSPVLADFDTSYSLVKNGGAENGMADWYSAWVSSVYSSTAPESSRCFRFSVPSDSHSDLRSPLYPIRKGETLTFEYRFRSDRSAVIEAGSSYAVIRSYGMNTNVILREDRFYLTTESEWTNFSHILEVAPDACYIDVRFMFNDAATGLHASGTMYLEDIAVYREIDPAPFYGDIQPLRAGDTLYVYDWAADPDAGRRIAVQTLQGLFARNYRPLIWIDDGNNPFRQELAEAYGIRFVEGYGIDTLLYLGGHIGPKRYVLYSVSDHDSVTAATALSGIFNAVAIDEELEPLAISTGYSMVTDVRGKDSRWVWETYRDRFNDTAIVVHQNDDAIHNSAYHLRDWAPALNCMEWWDGDENYSRRVYRSMAPCSPVYGWTDGATNDEGQAIVMHSEEGLVQIPSDWMLNLSVHASLGRALKDERFVQKVARHEPQAERNVHYVTFIQSDMDNILTEAATNSFYNSSNFYANPHRGEFPMSWGMAPSLVELAPTVLKQWYEGATSNDSFTAFCGLGYYNPSRACYLQTHATRLAGLMERADLRTLLILDNQANPSADLSPDYYDQIRWFTALPQVRGLFYLEYDGYARHNGQILWFDHKPLVTARFDFRDNAFYGSVRRTAADLANSINAMPTDPTRPDGYSVVIVHAWSRGMNDIFDTIQLLDPDVRVVNAEAFIEQLYLNIKPCRDVMEDGDFDGDCRVGFSDLEVLVSQWLHSGLSLPADADSDGQVDCADFEHLSMDWQQFLGGR